MDDCGLIFTKAEIPMRVVPMFMLVITVPVLMAEITSAANAPGSRYSSAAETARDSDRPLHPYRRRKPSRSGFTVV